MTKAIKFKNRYNTIGTKKEFWKEYDQKDMTDQSQLAGASIVEMAKKFGIDAIISKAEKMEIEVGNLQDQLFGHDLTKTFQNNTELLETKKKLSTVFERIPARMRKELFNDNTEEFLNAMTHNDEKKLEQLNKIGMISDTQLTKVKEYNKKLRTEAEENRIRKEFTKALEENKNELYTQFKKNGNIITNNQNNDTISNKDV